MTDRVPKFFLAGLLVILLPGCFQTEPGETTAVSELDTVIRNKVPAGSSTSQVIAFLDANKIEHSDFREKENAIYGIVRNKSGNWLVTGSAHIVFHFDKKAKLKDYTVKEIFTGP